MFKRPKDVPIQPGVVGEISKLVEMGADNGILANAIAHDPGLTVRFARNIGLFDFQSSTRSIELYGALEKAGIHSFRSFLTSTVISGTVVSTDGGLLDGRRLNKHSYVTGCLIGRYLENHPEYGLSPYEGLALGALHDIGFLLLAVSSPQAFKAVSDFAAQTGTSFDIAFSCIYPTSIYQLSAHALNAWRISPSTVDLIKNFDVSLSENMAPLRLLLRCADFISYELGIRPEPFHATTALPPGFEETLVAELDEMREIARGPLRIGDNRSGGTAIAA